MKAQFTEVQEAAYEAFRPLFEAGQITEEELLLASEAVELTDERTPEHRQAVSKVWSLMTA